MKFDDDAQLERKTIKTSTALVRHIENALGWLPPADDTRPDWKIRSIEAGKINRVIKKNKSLYTFDNLLLAVEYCRRKKIEVKAPVGVCYFVEQALAAAQVGAPTNVQADIARALEEARAAGEDDWVRRLWRAQGASAKAEALEGWREHRHGG